MWGIRNEFSCRALKLFSFSCGTFWSPQKCHCVVLTGSRHWRDTTLTHVHHSAAIVDSWWSNSLCRTATVCNHVRNHIYSNARLSKPHMCFSVSHAWTYTIRLCKDVKTATPSTVGQQDSLDWRYMLGHNSCFLRVSLACVSDMSEALQPTALLLIMTLSAVSIAIGTSGATLGRKYCICVTCVCVG